MSHLLDAVTPLTWRPVQPEDVAEVAELFTAIEAHDDPAERHSLHELRDNMAATGDRAASSTVLGRDRDTVVALGWNLTSSARPGYQQVFLSGGVHPSWRQLGIGRHLLSWQIDRARQHLACAPAGPAESLVVGHCDEKSLGRRSLYGRLGLLPVRRHLDLFRALSDRLPERSVPDGVRLRRWDPELSEQTRQAHNDAFSDVWRARPVESWAWAASHTREAARPDWSWLAVEQDSDRVVGYAISSASPEQWELQGFSQGWTDRLGVRREWRGRGLARTLLLASMRSFADAGLQAAGLGVDTKQLHGPLSPYHALGYTVTDSVIRHEVTDLEA